MKKFFSNVAKIGLGIFIGSTMTVFASQLLTNVYLNDGLRISINGEVKTMTDASTGAVEYPLTYRDRTYIPLRSVATLLGYEVGYDADSNTAMIYDKGYMPTKTETKTETKTDTVNYSMGSWNGNVYSNSFLGFKFTMPSGWTRYTNEQINELYQGVLTNNQDLFKLDTAELKKAIEESSVFYVFAINPNTGSNIQIMSEKPAVKVTTEQYLEAVKSGLQTVSNINYTDLVVSKTTLGGITFNSLTATASLSGISMKQGYYTIQIGDIFASIIVTDTSNEVNIGQLISKI